MALFEWQEQYGLNVKAMDLQHMHLVQMINDLYRALLSSNGRALLIDVMGRMAEYALNHFKDEEALLRAHDYPRLQSQVDEHNEFITKASQYQTQLNDGTLRMSTEVVNYLKQWLIDHIVCKDKEYGPFLNERGVF